MLDTAAFVEEVKYQRKQILAHVCEAFIAVNKAAKILDDLETKRKNIDERLGKGLTDYVQPVCLPQPILNRIADRKRVTSNKNKDGKNYTIEEAIINYKDLRQDGYVLSRQRGDQNYFGKPAISQQDLVEAKTFAAEDDLVFDAANKLTELRRQCQDTLRASIVHDKHEDLHKTGMEDMLSKIYETVNRGGEFRQSYLRTLPWWFSLPERPDEVEWKPELYEEE